VFLLWFDGVLVFVGVLPNVLIAMRETATEFELSVSNKLGVFYFLEALVIFQLLVLAFVRLARVRLAKRTDCKQFTICIPR
jgi:hypothetical protein